MRALVPRAAMMMAAGAPQATYPKLPPGPEIRKPQNLRMKTMWLLRTRPLPRRRCSRKNMAQLQPLSQECRRRHLQEGFPLPNLERLPLVKPWSSPLSLKRTAADQKRSCGYAPQIQELINSKMGTGTYLLDKDHIPIYPYFEDNQVVMDGDEPSSVHAQAKKEKARRRGWPP